MKPVWYLCDAPMDHGLVTTLELPEGYSSLGNFFIEEPLEAQYTFLTMEKGEPKTLKLTREDDRIYVVNHPMYGEFHFEIDLPTLFSYAGLVTRLSQAKGLYWLEPADCDKMEKVRQEHDFYFTGE